MVEVIIKRHPPYFATTGQTVAEIWQFSNFFNMVAFRHLEENARVWTSYEEYLVVLIVVQNVVAIGAAVSIICMILSFARLAKDAYSRRQNWSFGGHQPINGESYQRNPQKAHILWQKDVIGRIGRQNRSNGATCAHDFAIKTTTTGVVFWQPS